MSDNELEDMAERRAAVEAVKDLWEWRKTAANVDAMIKDLDGSASDYSKMGALRRWLTDHDGERLYDGEAGLVAYLQSGGESDAYDSPAAISERDPTIYKRLAELGCFAVDAKMVQERIKRGQLTAADIAPFVRKLARTPSLRIEESK